MRTTKIAYSKVTDEPAVEPISLTEAKLYLKVDDSTEDDLIDILRQSARESVEQRTQRSLITQTRTMKMDWFPSGDTILLPNGPVQEVTSVQYYDDDNDLVTLDANDYYVDKDSDIARIVVIDSWPSTYDRPNAVVIEYDTGYGDAGGDVPAPLRKAVLFMLGHLYENRQAVIVSGSPTGVIEMPLGVEYLVTPYIGEQVITY